MSRIRDEESETDWTKYDRVIIEYCCYPDSLMGKKTPDSKGCKVIRVTTNHDQTTEEGYNWLIGQIKQIPNHIPILLWGSIPCTGGTPWARYNLRKYPETFPKRLRKLRAEWRILTYNFQRVSEIIKRRQGHWALEWPTKCSYWESPNVTQFLRNQKEHIYIAKATGCAFNLTAIAGPLRSHPMSKSWFVKGTLPTIEKYLDRSCQCSSDVQHAPAEGANTAHSGRYTTAFVTAIHRAFLEVVRDKSKQQTSERTT